MDIAGIRKEYRLQQLSETDVKKDPLVQFNQWFNDALAAQVNEPNAMNLSTVKASGRPASRIVLLKGIEQNGFVFYTNYNSDKGQQLQHFAFASLCFFWPELERQVRIEGSIQKVSAELSDAYFQSRPYASRIGAWVSSQSEVIEGRRVLEESTKELHAKYPSQVPRPPHWGGYLLLPDYIEFWQGRESRLHDRLAYTLDEGLKWTISRLAP